MAEGFWNRKTGVSLFRIPEPSEEPKWKLYPVQFSEIAEFPNSASLLGKRERDVGRNWHACITADGVPIADRNNDTA